MGIATKINKGTIEIVSDVSLVAEGDKVGGSEATLLAKLGIKPFEYGLVILKVSFVLLVSLSHKKGNCERQVPVL